jgi:DNA-binding NtrC family response regulator
MDAPSTRLVPLPAGISFARGVRLIVVAGPDKGRTADLALGTWSIGTDPSCTLVLSDQWISRRHLELTVEAQELRLRDLGSTNGSYFQGARFDSLSVGRGSILRLGETELRLASPEDDASLPNRFGRLLGASQRMQDVFATLTKIAASELTLLVQGETGTGKELLAEAVHKASPRAAGPFVICDLAAPATSSLVEAELFGCVRGALPGVDADRVGAFKQADGGTLFLDQIGELDLEVQPRLLRAIERKLIKPVGAAQNEHANVRIIAATNRDLEADVSTGKFRQDLYHRMAVARVELPPLRERREDVPLLVAALQAHDWPGNVRQLRNVLERAVSLAGGGPVIDARVLGLEAQAAPPDTITRSDTGKVVPFKEAKERLVDVWEREYVVTLLERTKGNVSLAARRAGITRVYMHQLIRKHNVDRP